MTGWSVIQQGLEAGRWTGRLSTTDTTVRAPADLAVLHDGAELPGLRVAATPGEVRSWTLGLDLPREVFCEGTQVLLLVNRASGDVLFRIVLILGSPATEDLRAEVRSLRAELDQLRAAFRAEMRMRAQG